MRLSRSGSAPRLRALFASLSILAMLTATGCGGGGGSSAVTPGGPSQTAAPSSAYTCPSSDSASVARSSQPSEDGLVPTAYRHAVSRASGIAANSSLLAVTYNTAALSTAQTADAAREASLGGQMVRSMTFGHAGVTVRVLSVAAGQLSAVENGLRSQSGVVSVALTGARRAPLAVTTAYYPNDPYFRGFSSAGTYEASPYSQKASVPGQWDMHAMKLEDAFAYSQSGNGSGIVNGAALGSSSIKLAVIDTGEDTTHPELTSKIAYQKCFISDTNNNQSTSSFTTDALGHGTDVAGIAGADTGNSFGYTAAGGNVSIYGYRVFPTPDDNCATEGSTDPQCGASTYDIASAIEDAVAQHVNVINMSFGGGGCTGGTDDDPVEGAAIKDAINANIIVVAASGNDGASSLAAPACDTGVIAAGATSLADGQTNGSGNTSGNASNPLEYVTSYTDYGSPASSLRNSSAWGIVAPGGDPNGINDADQLHWIDNIWTSTPYQSSSSDQTFVGFCADDYPNQASTQSPVDCRTLIAGTSMASPHVAGAAALILAVNPAYQSPTAMKQLLCNTADDIGDPKEGCGRLNVYRAMATALNDPHLP